MSDGRPWQALILRSASVLTHYCTIFPCNLGMEIFDNQCSDPMNNDKDCRVGQLTTSGPKYKLQIQNTKCGVKIQKLGSIAGWKSMGLGFLPETSQTTAHHCVFYDLTFFGSLHMMRRQECSVLRLSRIILGTKSSSHLISTFKLALPLIMCGGNICEPGKKWYFTNSQRLFITICPWWAKHFTCIFTSFTLSVKSKSMSDHYMKQCPKENVFFSLKPSLREAIL